MSNNNPLQFPQHEFVPTVLPVADDKCYFRNSHAFMPQYCLMTKDHPIHHHCTCLIVGIEYCPVHRSTIICGKTDCIRPTGHTGDCWPVPPANTTPILDSVAEIEATRKPSGHPQLLPSAIGEYHGVDPLANKSHIKVVYTQQRIENGQHSPLGMPLHSIQHFACTVTVIQVVGKAALPQVAGVFFGLNCFAQGDTLAKHIAEVSGLEIVKEYLTVD